jgi:16S rRNA (guanine527-N7)-methyltransferase
MMATERLAELVERYGLGSEAAARLAELLGLLAADQHAPSSVTDVDVATDVHVADALSALDAAPLRDARLIADIGSGAGFPGLVLAIALPHANVALVESVRRKCEFLERAVSLTGTANATVVCSRAEEWREGLASNDVVTVRAVGPLALLCEYAAPLLVVGGTLVAWKGEVSPAEALAGDRAAGELGLERAVVVRSSPYPRSAGHHLHMYRKIANTPSRFPRRPGVARKHPLGVR